MREDDKKILNGIKEKLGQVFIDINKDSEDSAMLLVECIKEIDDLTQVIIEDKNSDSKSEDFANKHRPLCTKVGEMFTDIGLQYFIHIADANSKNSVTFGEMDEDTMARSIGGAMVMSELVFNGVLKEIGMPQNCIECIPSPTDREKEKMSRTGVMASVLGDMPEHLKRKLEERLEGIMRSLGPGKHTDEEISKAIESELGGVARPLKGFIKLPEPGDN